MGEKRKYLYKKILAFSLTIAAFVTLSNNVFAVERKVIKEGENVRIENQQFNSINFDGLGGAINNNGTVTINGSSFSQNSARTGGAIYNKENDLNISNSTFSSNQAIVKTFPEIKIVPDSTWKYDEKTNTATKVTETGETITATPSINNYNGTISVTTYIDNGSGGQIANTEIIATFEPVNLRGGAIASYGGNVQIENSTFENNNILLNDSSELSDEARGGAVYTNGNTVIKNSRFSNNSAIIENSNSSSLTDMKIENTYHYGSGGAIYTENGNLDISESLFEHNSSTDGGAIYTNGTANIKNSSFINNTALSEHKYNSSSANSTTEAIYRYGSGGAISANNADLNILDSTFKNNISFQGGAISNGKNLTISNSTFNNNRATALQTNMTLYQDADKETITSEYYTGKGGALAVAGTLNIDNSAFNNNIAADSGGAIAFVPTISDTLFNTIDITVKNSTFNGNKTLESSSVAMGGAISTGDNFSRDGKLNIENSVFTNNESMDGGAIYSSVYNTRINNSQFINNKANKYQGGAISIAVYDISTPDDNPIETEKQISIENSNFENNYSHTGGAIYATGGNTNIKNSTFTNNNALVEENSTTTNSDSITERKSYSGFGGAITVEDQNLNISNSTFENNTSRSGGAVSHVNERTHNDIKLTVNNSAFNNNKAATVETTTITYTDSSKAPETQYYYVGDGGAIEADGSLVVNNSTFNNNIAGNSGGAIFGEADITIKNSVFNNNKTLEPTSSGGALSTGRFGDAGISTQANNNLNIENSSFVNNESTNAGAIYYFSIPGANVTISNSNFINNKATKSVENDATFSDGGAISIMNMNLGNLFPGLGSDYTEPNGKTIIEASNFVGNSAALGYGGAISNVVSKLFITDTNFKNNTAKTGGAIAVGDDTTITALNNNVVFSGNTAEKGNDIYIGEFSTYSAFRENASSPVNLNLNANKNKTITFQGGIVGNNAIININKPDASIYDQLSSVGKVIVDNVIESEAGSTLDLNVFNGSLNLTDEKYLNNVNLTLEENGILDLRNGQTGLVSLGDFTSNNGTIYADIDFSSNQPFDWIESDSGTGTVNIKDINIISDMQEGTNSYEADLKNLDLWEDVNIQTPENGIDSVTENYVYTTKIDNNKLIVTRLTDENNNAVEVDGFTIAVNQQDTVAGKDITLSDDRIYTATKDIEITAQGSQKGWTGNLGGKILTVNGNNHTLDGKDKNGFTISDGQTLTFNDTNITGFTKDDNSNIFTVQNDGILNLNNVKVTGANSVVSGSSKEAVINLDNVEIKDNAAGITTAGSVNISRNAYFENNGNGIEVTSDDSIITLNGLDGDGEFTFNDRLTGVAGAKLNLNNANANFNKEVSALDVNMNNSTANLGADNLMNGLNMTVNTASNINMVNNAVGNMHLSNLTLNDNLNLDVDVDLANKSMDRISADSYNLGENKVNVSHMNLTSDATEAKTNIQFADEGLKNNVTTSVSEVAYSPIYKYGVGYDKTNGQFEFTRSNASSYDNLNPSVMVSPVAAQLGGYMGMIDTYHNAFNNMDMRMLQSSSFRNAQRQANRYAIAEGAGTYTENNSAGIWARPFTSYDSVGLKHGPSVHSLSYGTFIGGDSGYHDFGNGYEGVFSTHISYQGSHQTFADNSIYQNGVNLGFTGTLYKGNFFTGLNATTGVSIADASTMYGDENFPMLMAGVASKTGYNFEFKGGKFIIQPSLLLSYTFVNTFDYTNAAGVKIDAQPLHAIQLAPNIRFSLNTKNGWQPYFSFSANWNLMNNSDNFLANTTALPELSVRPYFQYGFGVQKLFNDNFTGFAQVALRHGGRNGVAATAGMRYLFGHTPKSTPVQKVEQKETIKQAYEQI